MPRQEVGSVVVALHQDLGHDVGRRRSEDVQQPRDVVQGDVCALLRKVDPHELERVVPLGRRTNVRVARKRAHGQGGMLAVLHLDLVFGESPVDHLLATEGERKYSGKHRNECRGNDRL